MTATTVFLHRATPTFDHGTVQDGGQARSRGWAARPSRGSMPRRLVSVGAWRWSGLALALVLAPGVAVAGPTPPPSGQRTEPGTCSILQPQVKQCSVSPVGGVGTFDATVMPPAGLVVAFEDAVTGMQPPPSSSYRASFSGTTATVVPLRRDPIPGATVHFDTATVHVTLNLKLGRAADTQLVIIDPRRALRDEEVERKVKEAVDGLEERASRLLDESLLADIAASGVEVAGVEATVARKNQVVLRAERIVRIGSRRVLVLTIDNRSADELEVTGIRAWTGADGPDRNDHELPHPLYRLAGKTVGVNEGRTLAVSLPGLAVPSPPSRPRGLLRLRVEFSDPGRNVELAGIRWR